MSTLDAEVLDLLRDRPDLLRLATAVADLKPSTAARPRRVYKIAIAAGIAMLLAAGALVAWPDRGPGVVDKALAAVSTGPVIHAVVERSSPDNLVVNLATGLARERIHAIEYWYDRERSILHTRLLTDGKMLTEIVETPTGSDSDLGHYPGGIAAQLDPALAGFVTRYRDALAKGAAEVVSRDGDVTIIRISLGPGATEDVGVDSDSYRPISLTYRHQDQVMQTWRVASIEAVDRDSRFFAKPKRSAPRPTGGGEIASQSIAPTDAATALERPSLWLGQTFRNLPLTDAIVSLDRADYTDGSTHEGKRLVLRYGGEDPLTIGQAASVAGSYQLGFNDGGDPPAPQGSLVLERTGSVWTGELVRDGIYLSLRSSDRDLILDAARALTEMP
jgi:hypothetical protein